MIDRIYRWAMLLFMVLELIMLGVITYCEWYRR